MSEPLTEYTRFGLAAYSDNIAAGEKIGIIPRAALTDADQGWASEDFSIFDEKLVVLLSYDDTGRFLGAQQPKDIRSYLEVEQRALSLAVDFHAFVAEFKP